MLLSAAVLVPSQLDRALGPEVELVAAFWLAGTVFAIRLLRSAE